MALARKRPRNVESGFASGDTTSAPVEKLPTKGKPTLVSGITRLR
ncbi:hypothetical protein [Alteribacillus sp. HJP-4]